jgi:dTDP-4-dehydrorhamnose reductase
MKKILITGSDGQLGTCMKECVFKETNLNIASNNYIFVTHEMLDITDKFDVMNYVNTIKPDVVVNCAAYTNVEGAEDNIDTAFLVNSNGVDNLAYACYLNNASLIHISTDFVFSGNKTTLKPYKEDDETDPLNIYGKSKHDGEISALWLL